VSPVRVNNDGENNAEDNMDGTFDCSECDRSFNSRIGLSRHSTTHSSSQCDICHKHMKDDEALASHMMRVHGSHDAGSDNE
ncbi:hypothetical protein PMAYCL1PPCAC_31177, partial [Pristionchus mayeri]